jgi:dimethylargininase
MQPTFAPTSSGRFTRAIVCTPAANFADGLTSVDLGAPDYACTLEQHAAYCRVLAACGLELTTLPADERFPDSTFVEDTAILTGHGAILARPGAASRRGEVEPIRAALAAFYPQLAAITAPGELDGGDICEAGDHFLIGISARTDAEGAAQLAAWLAGQGCTSACIDIRNTPGILHLKSGLAYIGDNHMIVIDALADHPALAAYELVRVEPGEEYAANCVRVNDHLLLPAGYERLAGRLRALGYAVVELAMSEFRKMDGGLSCLSLRF